MNVFCVFKVNNYQQELLKYQIQAEITLFSLLNFHSRLDNLPKLLLYYSRL